MTYIYAANSYPPVKTAWS